MQHKFKFLIGYLAVFMLSGCFTTPADNQVSQQLPEAKTFKAPANTVSDRICLATISEPAGQQTERRLATVPEPE